MKLFGLIASLQLVHGFDASQDEVCLLQVTNTILSYDRLTTDDEEQDVNSQQADAEADAKADAKFHDFKARYGKVYTADDEDSFRVTYKDNMRWAAENSAPDLMFGENQFSDLNQEQFRVASGLGFVPESQGSMLFLGEHLHDGEALSDSVDWTTKGAVTPVKDAGQCGAGWAFSTTGGVEGAWQISTGSLETLSEQQLIDCSTINRGCENSNAAQAFTYMNGVDVYSEVSYPYKAAQNSCMSSGTTVIPQGGVTGYMRVGDFMTGASVNEMKSAIQQQPVSISIQADQISFQSYSSGVLSSGCGRHHSHAALAVGYGTENGQDYWLVKNSWSKSWGDMGYIKIKQAGNLCGVLSQAMYPQVTGSVALVSSSNFDDFKGGLLDED